MKSGIKTIIAGVVMFIFGAVIVPLLFLFPLIFGKSNEVQFKVPGTCEVSVEKPGCYYLLNDFQTFYDGRSYNRSETVPDGTEIKILNSDGTELHFASDTSFSFSSGSSSKKSIGYVDIKSSGKIKIEVSGGNEERVFSFEPLSFVKVIGLVFAAFATAGIVGIGGIGICVWGIVKLVRENK